MLNCRKSRDNYYPDFLKPPNAENFLNPTQPNLKWGSPYQGETF